MEIIFKGRQTDVAARFRDLATAKLDSRLRRALDRRKRHHLGHNLERTADRLGPEQAAPGLSNGSSPQARHPAASGGLPRQQPARQGSGMPASQSGQDQSPSDSVVPIEMEGDGPLVVRQKVHQAMPITIDQALLEMELVGHDFYLFHDIDEDVPSVVYRRHGYQYGVIRLVETPAERERRAPVPGAQAGVSGRRSAASSDLSR